MRYTVIGAGITGATIARLLAEKGNTVTVFEKEKRVGGACYDEVKDNLPVCQFGGHIFHTNNYKVWEFVTKFAYFNQYEHRVIAQFENRGYFNLPLNLQTISAIFGHTVTKEEFESYICSGLYDESNFENKAIKSIGFPLYLNFFYYYTKKHWGIKPSELPPEIFSRLPLRYNFDTRYFSDAYQGMPEDGYTEMISNILNHKNITTTIGIPAVNIDNVNLKHRVIFTGSIDQFYSYRYGILPYRTVNHDWSDNDLGCATINQVGPTPAYTREICFNYFYPEIKTNRFYTAKEYPINYHPIFSNPPLYPIPLWKNLELYRKYSRYKDSPVIFAGRLGTYKYLNMDTAIEKAMHLVETIC